MLKAVFDTNIIVSAAIKKEGLPALLLSLFLEGKINLFISPPLLAEYEEVLKRPKFGLKDQLDKGIRIANPREFLIVFLAEES
ncbi:putative toxin-antitoxin system toxin component, PIN family [bacterium]|nr:putative toxin-antitoxin system toxin component, PIN family [bacterium]